LPKNIYIQSNHETPIKKANGSDYKFLSLKPVLPGQTYIDNIEYKDKGTVYSRCVIQLYI